MCRFPRYHYPAVNVLPRHKKCGFGWNENARAFVFDKRRVDVLEALSVLYPRTLDYLTEIPCGQCMECRINTSKELAQRALAEATMHEENYFITLTYDDDHLLHTYRECVSRQSGEVGLFPCLCIEDFQLFAKRLRERIREKYGETGILNFYCGEYGEQNGRPHFHAIIYGIPLKSELKTFKTVNVKGKTYEYLTCPLVEDCWKQGFITVAEVNWETCAYVARYVTKKMIGKSETEYQLYCDSLGFAPQPREFHITPKRPGLGLTYLEAHMDEIYSKDKVVLPGGKSLKPCKYYDDKFDLVDPELLAMNKEARKKKMQLIHMNEYRGKDPGMVALSEEVKHAVFERKIKQKLKRTL